METRLSEGIKTQADRLVAALRRKPELLQEVLQQLTPGDGIRVPVGDDDVLGVHVAFAVLMVEHEFGQRDEGWTLHATRDEALAWKKKQEGPPGSPGQAFTYHVSSFEVTSKVWRLLKSVGLLYSKNNRLPFPDTIITATLLRH